MKVRYASDLLRPEVIATLKLYNEIGVPGFEDIEGLVEFLEMFSRWWAMMDTANTTQ